MLKRREDRELAVGDRDAWPFLTKDQMMTAGRTVPANAPASD
jgi:hypothetical protein